MCELCGKTFSERNTMETHKLIHTGTVKWNVIEFGLDTENPSDIYSHLFVFCSRKDVFLRRLWQEVCDAVYAAETHAVDPWEGGGSELPPVWHQSLHTRLHEPPHAPQTPRGETLPHASKVNDISDQIILFWYRQWELRWYNDDY